MPNFKYLGYDERVYPEIVIPGEGTLVAHPGDVKELDEAPDNRWAESEPEPAEPESEPEPEHSFWTEDK